METRVAQPTYRQFLQSAANADPNNRAARVLLDAVGDDFKLNANFYPKAGDSYGEAAWQQLNSYNDIMMDQYKNQYMYPGGSGGNTLAAVNGGGSVGGGGGVSTSVFDTQIAGLRDLLESLDPQRQSAEKQVNNLYSTGKANIESARDRGLENLNQQNLKVESSRARSLRDLSESLSGSQQAFSNRLGTMGAGASSASEVMAPFAFSKLGARGRTDVNNQATEALGQIGVRQGDLESEVLAQLRELDTFKQNSMLQIAEQFRATKMQIMNDIRMTQAEKADALSNASRQAVSALTNLDSYSNQIKNSIRAPQAGPSFQNPAAQAAQNLQVAPVRSYFGFGMSPGLGMNPQRQSVGGTNLQSTGPGMLLQGTGREDDLQSGNIASLLQGGRRQDLF